MYRDAHRSRKWHIYHHLNITKKEKNSAWTSLAFNLNVCDGRENTPKPWLNQRWKNLLSDFFAIRKDLYFRQNSSSELFLKILDLELSPLTRHRMDDLSSFELKSVETDSFAHKIRTHVYQSIFDILWFKGNLYSSFTYSHFHSEKSKRKTKSANSRK